MGNALKTKKELAQELEAARKNLSEVERLKKALRESEEKFTSVFKHNPLGLSITRLRDNVVVEINDSYTTFTGYTRAEIVGRKVSEMNTWRTPAEREQMLAMLKEKGRISSEEYCLRTRSGELHPTLLSAERINFEGEDCLIVMAADISGYKQAEEELRESEEFTSSLLKNTPHPIIVINPDHTIKYVNPAFEKLTGFTLNEIIGMKTPYPWWPQETKGKIDAVLKQASFDGGITTEMVYQKKSGERFWVELNATSINENGERKYTLVNWVDITERRKTEEALRMSEQKYAGLVEHGNDGILIIQDHVIKYLNSKLLDIFGYSYEEVIGKQFASVISEESREIVIARSRKRLAGEEVPEKYEFVIINKKGERVNLEVNASLMEFEGRPADMAIVRDVTARKKSEEALKDSEEKFSKAFNVSGNAICITSLSDNKFVEINEAYTLFTGYTREEAIGHTAAELKLWIYPEELTRLQTLLIKDGKFSNVELHSRMKSGEIRVGLSSAALINIGGKPCRISVIIDITERKKAEEALKESEEKFSKAFNSSANAIGITSIKDNCFVEVNESFIRFTGYSREEVIGRSSPELKLWVKPDELQRWMDALQKDGRVFNQEFSSRMKSGEVRIGLASAEVINIGGEPCRIVMITDITKRKKAEEALKELEEKYRAIYEQASDSIVLIDRKNPKIVDFNTRAHENLGYTREEFAKLEITDINAFEPTEEIEGRAEKTFGEGKNFLEIKHKTKSGEIRDVLASLRFVNLGGKELIMAIWHDITERKKAEEALQNSEENFRNSLEDSPLGIRIVNTTGKTVYVNHVLLDIYGYGSLDEFKSIPIEKRFAPGMLEKHLSIRRKMAQHEVMPESGETSIVRKDGAIRHLAILTKEVYWNGEKQYQLLYQDITERKKAETSLEQALANLEQSNTRLAASNKELEAFSYSVSHDLRSPLRSIDGFSQALLEDYAGKLDVTAQDYLKRLRNASQKMGELIDGMLRLSRLSRSALHLETIDMGALASEIATRLRESQPERQVELIIGGDLTVYGDPQLIRALLENLLGNAWKFTGKVPRAVIEFSSIQSNGQKTFFVKDNGAGFDMSYVDKLFGAFQRLHDVADFPGTGIGLATVQRIVNRHGGMVRAEGEVGKGAVFYFTLG